VIHGEQTQGEAPVIFDIWGCRGSRSLIPARSKIGNNTSCYSISQGNQIIAIDAGRGLGALSHAIGAQNRFDHVTEVNILISHAHMDHWEGLKDAEWFWVPYRSLRVNIYAGQSTIDAIERAHGHPSYVALQQLGNASGNTIEFIPISCNQKFQVGDWKVETFRLNHFSGNGESKLLVETFGYRIAVKDGPIIAYLSDHMPSEAGLEDETRGIKGAHMALFDAHYPEIADQNFGHGSQEYASSVARKYPEMLVFAAHHGAGLSDGKITDAFLKFGKDLPNYKLAIENETYRWNRGRRTFAKTSARTLKPTFPG
jgi:phosphoribosyl 1,2-cyclic phosphodiesterase